MENIRSRSGIEVEVMDLRFQGQPGLIASYLIRHDGGALIIETGPGTTTGGLELQLNRRGLTPADVTHVLVTHIHLDHAGAAGWLASHGAQIYVHPNGAPHLAAPEKLLASAGRIYGEAMDQLWGEFLPVPQAQLTALNDGDEVVVGGVSIVALDTPGHAEHHLAFLLDDICFTGDIAGVRMAQSGVVVPPMPPPEFAPERWLASLDHIAAQRPEFLAPTHFGLFLDPQEHLDALRHGLEAAQQWAAVELERDAPVEALQARYSEWLRQWALDQGLDPHDWPRHELINPAWMSALGLRRHWKKRQGR